MPTSRKKVTHPVSEPTSMMAAPQQQWLPPGAQSKKGYTPILVIGLIIASFFVGMLFDKVSYLQSGNNTNSAPSTTGQTGQAAPTQGDAKTAFVSYAKQVGMDTNKFEACLTSGKYKQNVANDQADGTKVSVNGTPSFFINGIGLVGALPYDMFKTVLDHELSGSQDPIPSSIPVQPKVSVTNGHLPTLGNKNAAVTLVEFSDFQCPFCGQFYTQTEAQLRKDYVDSGKVQFVYRQFPLTQIHPNAEGAAEASECANEQGKFWQYHDLLFQTQSAWENAKPLATT